MLAEEVLDLRARPPAKPSPVTLEGAIVSLVPLDLERDVEALHAASDGRPNRWGERRAPPHDPETAIWLYMPAGPFRDSACVEWKCDSLNERSRRAAERMGFSFEGVQDAHYIVKGRNRDTAWFRMLEREWPEVRRSSLRWSVLLCDPSVAPRAPDPTRKEERGSAARYGPANPEPGSPKGSLSQRAVTAASRITRSVLSTSTVTPSGKVGSGSV
jgi:hypothetical protein